MNREFTVRCLSPHYFYAVPTTRVSETVIDNTRVRFGVVAVIYDFEYQLPSSTVNVTCHGEYPYGIRTFLVPISEDTIDEYKSRVADRYHIDTSEYTPELAVRMNNRITTSMYASVSPQPDTDWNSKSCNGNPAFKQWKDAKQYIEDYLDIKALQIVEHLNYHLEKEDPETLGTKAKERVRPLVSK